MATIPLVLALLACAGHGRRLKIAGEQLQDGSYAEHQNPQKVSHTSPSSYSLAELKQSQSNARAGASKPHKLLTLLLLAFSNSASAFAPASLRSLAGRLATGNALRRSAITPHRRGAPIRLAANDHQSGDNLNFAGMKAGELETLLKERRVSTEGCSNKKQLLERAEQFRYLLEGPPPAPTLQISIDSKQSGPWGSEQKFSADSLRTQSAKPSETWYNSDLPGRLPDAFWKAMDSSAPLVMAQGAITSLVLPYQPLGIVQAVNGAVGHRWQRLSAEQRPLILLAIRQLSQLRAVGPDLVAAALSVGSSPPMGKSAGLEREAVEVAFGPEVAQLLVELQQMLLIERTVRTFPTVQDGSFQLSESEADLALSLFTGQKMQMSSRSLVLFVVLKASEIRLLSGLGVDSTPLKSLVLSAALALQVFAPLANLLGLGSVKAELEDAAFAILKPDERAKLRGLLGDDRSEDLANGAARKLEQALKQKRILDPHRFAGLSSLRVNGRSKSAYSTWKKMTTKQMDFGQVLDKAGIRVILDAQTAQQGERLCYIVRDLVGELFPLEARREKDYVQHPKLNGYQSLHVVARWKGQPFEVQIRTEEMHRKAEYGSSGHWEYKAGGKGSFGAAKAAVNAGRDLFGRVDTDGDGQITDTELQAALTTLGVEATLEQVKDMLVVFGTNQDGALEFKEFWNALITTWFPLISGTHVPRKTNANRDYLKGS